jgi:hypothetical protein
VRLDRLQEVPSALPPFTQFCVQTSNHNASDYADANGARFAALLAGYELGCGRSD